MYSKISNLEGTEEGIFKNKLRQGIFFKTTKEGKKLREIYRDGVLLSVNPLL